MIILSISQSVLQQQQHTPSSLLFYNTTSTLHTYSSSPYNGFLHVLTPSPASPSTVNPYASLPPHWYHISPTDSRFDSRVLSCSNVRLCTHALRRCRALDFRYTTTCNLLAGRAVAVYLSLSNFTHDALLTSLSRCTSFCSRVDIWISSTPGAINARSNYPLVP